MRNKELTSQVTTALLIIYLLITFWIIVLKMNVPMTYKADAKIINLIPYQASTILNGSVSYAEILLNVVIFIPFGLYANPLFRSSSFLQKVGLFFFFSLLFELTQYFLGGSHQDAFWSTNPLQSQRPGAPGVLAFSPWTTPLSAAEPDQLPGTGRCPETSGLRCAAGYELRWGNG